MVCYGSERVEMADVARASACGFWIFLGETPQASVFGLMTSFT